MATRIESPSKRAGFFARRLHCPEEETVDPQIVDRRATEARSLSCTSGVRDLNGKAASARVTAIRYLCLILAVSLTFAGCPNSGDQKAEQESSGTPTVISFDGVDSGYHGEIAVDPAGKAQKGAESN
jgi:hypothetical protein